MDIAKTLVIHSTSEVPGIMPERRRSAVAWRSVDDGLTPHEIRVLKCLVEGHTYKTAAVELRVSIHTVSFHLRRIYEKLQVHSKSEAVGKALREGLVY